MDYWSSPQSFWLRRSGGGLENFAFRTSFLVLLVPLRTTAFYSTSSWHKPTTPWKRRTYSFIHSPWVFHLPRPLARLSQFIVLIALSSMRQQIFFPSYPWGKIDAFLWRSPLEKALFTVNSLLIIHFVLFCGRAIQLSPDSWVCPSGPPPSSKLQVTKRLIWEEDGGKGALALASEPEKREVPDQFLVNTNLHISHKALIY